MKKIAIIGAGISGLASANLLKARGYKVTVFDKNKTPGGLIRCTIEDGNLFHRVGGHVFNTKMEDVNNWFWAKFNKQAEFINTKRNAQILLHNKRIGYPIENNLYNLPKENSKKIIQELVDTNQNKNTTNFKEFLETKFGEELYNIYFKPYNTKIWDFDLEKIPLPWLDGKLPMPNIAEIFTTNIFRNEETDMVHSTFYYPQKNGSSFIANRLSEGLNIQYESDITKITWHNEKWTVNDNCFDHIIFTGDVRKLQSIIRGVSISNVHFSSINNLPSNGTTTVLCYTDKTDLSWLYIPDSSIHCHRIIYTGNFSEYNNKPGRNTCTVEFSGYINEETILKDLKKLPGNLQPIAYNHEPNSYVIQQHDTRANISLLKKELSKFNLSLIGRFAEWEYYNMDMAIAAAMKTCNNI